MRKFFSSAGRLATHHAVALIVVMALGQSPRLIGGEAPDITGLKISDNGEFQSDGVRFSVVHYGLDWTYTGQSGLEVSPGFPKVSRDTWEIQGTLQPAEVAGPIHLSQKIEKLKERGEGFRVSYEAAHEAQLPTRLLCVAITIPADAGAGKPVTLGGQTLDLPVELGGAVLSNRVEVDRFILPTRAGTLEITGERLKVEVLDNRTSGSKQFSVRVAFPVTGKKLTDSNLSLTVVRRDPQ